MDGGSLATPEQLRLEDVNFQIPPISTLVAGNEDLPAEVQTPLYHSNPDGSLTVVFRQRDVRGGHVTVNVPVQVVSRATGQPLAVTSDNKFLSFAGQNSTPARLEGGVARIPLRVAVNNGSAPVRVDLSRLNISAAPGGVNSANADLCEQQDVEVLVQGRPGPGSAATLGLMMIPWNWGKAAAEWMGPEGLIGAIRLGVSFVPIVGSLVDCTEIYHRIFTNQEVDPLDGQIACIGISIDAGTTVLAPQMAPAVRNTLRALRPIIRATSGNGVIRQVARSLTGQFVRGQLSPADFAQRIQNLRWLQRYGDNRAAIRDVEEIGSNMVAKGKSAEEALDEVDTLLRRIQRGSSRTPEAALADLKSYSDAARNAATNNNWTSPGGLFYGSDPGSNGNVTRLNHLMLRHGPNQTYTYAGKSQFASETEEELLLVIDEAWAKHLAGQSLPGPQSNNVVVNLGRVIGTQGERTILISTTPSTNKVITIFPCLRAYHPNCGP